MAYVKNTWATGDKITAAKMNHLEDGVAGAEGAVVSVNGQTGAVVLNANDVGAASVSALAHTNDALDALFKLTRGQAWDIVQDNTTAYQKTIPSGTHLSVLNGWGGESIVWNQIAPSDKKSFTNTQTDTHNKINFRWRIDVSPYTAIISSEIDLNFTGKYDGVFVSSVSSDTNLLHSGAVQNITLAYNLCNVITGHKYYFSIDFLSADIQSVGGLKTDNLMIVDLTAMGLADIITTPEQFRAMFPLDYYPYNAGETMHGGVTSIVLKDTDQTTVKTLTVPVAVRALTGYGQTGSAVAYNAADKTWAYTYNGVTTDITDLMADFDNYLSEVEPGGTLTFVNSHGADYGIPVPSQIDHYRNLSEVTP